MQISKLCSLTLALAFIGAAGTLTPAAHAQDLTLRSAAQSQPIALIGVDIYPVDGAVISDGYLLFSEGKITALGPSASMPRLTDKVKIIDARTTPTAPARLRVYPGLISPFTRMGLEEIGSVRPSRDMNEAGDITPEATAAAAVNPDSWLMPVARTNGVLAFGVFPTGGSLAGRASVISADGWTVEDLTVKRDAGQVVSWPSMRTIRAWWMDLPEEEQLKRQRDSLERISSAFRQAKAYIAAKDADPKTPTDLRWEAMRSLFKSDKPAGEKSTDKAADKPTDQRPIFVEAQEYDQILSAAAFAKREGLKLIIVGGRDAPAAAAQLKEIDAGVIINSVLNLPRRDDSSYAESYALPARLKEAGVRFCIASGEETPHERNLPYAAALAAAHGLSREDALRSITLSAAELLGVADRLGSLTPSKDATLLITDGDALDVRTTVKAAYIQGRPVDLSNKQSALAEKYREKYRQRPAKDAEKKDADKNNAEKKP